MKSIVLTAFFLCLCSPLALAGNFDWDEYGDLVKKNKTQKRLDAQITLPAEKVDRLRIRVGHNIFYLVDFKTKICYEQPGDNYVIIDCQKLKAAYPELSEVLDRL